MLFSNMYQYLIVAALIIIFMAMYLGSIRKFYDKYAWWDRLIHFLAGVLFVSFGVSISTYIAGLNRFHVLLFSFTLSTTLHVLWEIAEYSVDLKKQSNHQRWKRDYHSVNHKQSGIVQPAGLVDTMSDTIFCVLGALIACIGWWFVL